MPLLHYSNTFVKGLRTFKLSSFFNISLLGIQKIWNLSKTIIKSNETFQTSPHLLENVWS